MPGRPASPEQVELEAGGRVRARIGQDPLESAGQRGRGLGVDWRVSTEETDDDLGEEHVDGDVDVGARG